MKKTSRFLSLILCVVLVAAMALTAVGCGKKDNATADGTFVSGATLGDGATTFTLEVVDQEANTVTATVKTDEETVGAALLALGVIAGEDSEYGLYVKTVNGITLDYDTDGKYWAFYIDGEYAMTGVDSTDVVDGSTYKFAAE